MRAREHVWVTEWARAYVHAGTAEVYLNGGVEPKKKRERGPRVSHQLSVNPCFLSSTLRKRVLPIYCSRTSGFLSALIGGWKKRAASSALAAACVPERRCSRSGLGPIQQSGKCLFRWVPRGRGWEGDFKLGQSKLFFFFHVYVRVGGKKTQRDTAAGSGRMPPLPALVLPFEPRRINHRTG